MCGINIASPISLLIPIRTKVRNGSLVRAEEEGGRYSSVHPTLTVLVPGTGLTRHQQRRRVRYRPLPCRVPEARNPQLSVCTHVQ